MNRFYAATARSTTGTEPQLGLVGARRGSVRSWRPLPFPVVQAGDDAGREILGLQERVADLSLQ
jgi:hypothetical protein